MSIQPVPLDANDRPRLDLVTRGLDFSDPEIAGAVTECSDTLAAGALDFVTDELVSHTVIGQLEFLSRCLRARGLEFPDPIPGFKGVGSPYPVAEIPYSDPGLGEAIAACSASVLRALPGLSD